MPLVALPLIPPTLVALGKAVAFVGSAAVAAYGANHVINEMSKADEEADARPEAGSVTDVCTNCEQEENPCRHLERGIGDGPYRGGSYRGTSIPWGDRLDAHHTPAAAASPLPYLDSPAIQMEPIDHWMTASNGRVPGHAGYIAAQRSMANSGNFLGAVAMDVADIRAKFGTKYDEAIAEMEAYTACLKNHGIVQ